MKLDFAEDMLTDVCRAASDSSENLWTTIKANLYGWWKVEQQKNDLLDFIKTIYSKVAPSINQNLTKLMIK